MTSKLPAVEATKPQGISFPSDLLDLAKAAARKDGRSLSGYVRKLIQEDLEKQSDGETAAFEIGKEDES